jgi:hypothetical protein
MATVRHAGRLARVSVAGVAGLAWQRFALAGTSKVPKALASIVEAAVGLAAGAGGPALTLFSPRSQVQLSPALHAQSRDQEIARHKR